MLFEACPKATNPVTLTIATPGGRPIVLTGEPVNGLVTFTNCLVNKPGEVTIHADSAGTGITAVQQKVKVRDPSALPSVRFKGTPLAVSKGESFMLVLCAVDEDGNPMELDEPLPLELMLVQVSTGLREPAAGHRDALLLVASPSLTPLHLPFTCCHVG